MKAARASWNFSGYVTSDSDAVGDACHSHHYAKTCAEASCMALRDGQCDIDSGNTYYGNLLLGVAAKKCTMADIDRALFNSFRVRFELGLFDDVATQPWWKLGERDIGTDASAALNLKAAESSLVLIQNPAAVLPLSVGAHVAVIGPHANASKDLIQHDTGKVCPTAEPWDGGHSQTMFDCVRTPHQEIAAANRGGATTLTQGCKLTSPLAGGLAAAVAAARAADVVVLGLGLSERTGRTPDALPFLETEGHDRTSIDLPEAQHALAKAVIALGKPTVVFLLNGGMVALDAFVGTNVSIVEAFYPGFEGSKALAQSLFGQANRWGKMPYTVYKASWANENSMLDHDVTHQRTYRYGADAVVPFGAGRSLTEFALAFEEGVPAPCVIRTGASGSLGSSSCDYKIRVSNRGRVDGDEVVQAYFHPVLVAVTQHPVKSMYHLRAVSTAISKS
jgi:beta-D-xylosidase 4